MEVMIIYVVHAAINGINVVLRSMAILVSVAIALFCIHKYENTKRIKYFMAQILLMIAIFIMM